MAFSVPAEVGDLFDFGLATRDGATLPCRNRLGATQNVSQVGYVCSTDKQKPQHEATELQRKAQLVQLSNQSLDREFDQWPNNTQGDWSSGLGQRVFSGPKSDPAAYWDGLGVLWPINDYMPQQPLQPSPDQAEAGARMKFAGNGVAGGAGAFFSGSTPAPAYAYAYMQNSAPQHNILVLQTLNNTRKLDPIPGSTAGTPMTNANTQAIDYCFGLGYLWLVTPAAGGVAPVTVGQYTDGAPPTLVTSVAIAGAQTSGPSGFGGTRVVAGAVAGRAYLAVLFFRVADVTQVIRLYDVTTSTFTSFVDLTFATAGQDYTNIVQIDFQGDNLVIAFSTGQKATIVAYNIGTNSYSTLASFPNASAVYFCAIAGGLFVLAANDTAIAGFGNTVDMYLLQGSGLQHVGPVYIQSSTLSAGDSIAGETEPVAFGPYAIFTIYYRPASSGTTNAAVFAYDVLRGRLFKMADIGGYDILLGASPGRRMAVVAPFQRTFNAGLVPAQWMAGVPVLSGSGSAQDVTNVQNLMMGVTANGFGNAFAQQAVQITSSLFDFTSAQPKLFRQVLARFTALPNDAAITVKLDVWLDQDPANLAVSPDFTTTLTGGAGTVGTKQLALLINTVGTKLVYRITTTGPSSTFTPAVKLISVAVQAATGWVWELNVPLARNALTNQNNQETVWERQKDSNKTPIDEVVAYNFLRQLWRLRGGQCVITLANGDTYNALLQEERFDSPKPFGVSLRGDIPDDRYETLAFLRIREDV